jgi:hypothetical protein
MALQAITPSDSTTFNPPLKRLFVGVATSGQTVAVVDVNGNAATLENPQVGVWIKFHNSPIAKVKSTGTTASAIVGDTNPEN